MSGAGPKLLQVSSEDEETSVIGKPKPRMLGYQAEKSGESGRVALEVFAQAEGYALGNVFVEVGPAPGSAMSALVEAVARENPAVVGVPSMADLGRVPRMQDLLYVRLSRETGVPVLVADAAS